MKSHGDAHDDEVTDGFRIRFAVCAGKREERTDFMTAEVTILPTETITTAANRIVNEVKNINRVMFDYTTKPPATIEFE